jgi:hypothetical protein
LSLAGGFAGLVVGFECLADDFVGLTAVLVGLAFGFACLADEFAALTTVLVGLADGFAGFPFAVLSGSAMIGSAMIESGSWFSTVGASWFPTVGASWFSILVKFLGGFLC